MKRILVIDGHPSPESLTAALARSYADAARGAGHLVESLTLRDLNFDPILHQGYRTIQPLEPDLLRAQELILWSEHQLWAYPCWWGNIPALLKGFVDRTILPGYGFKHRENSPFSDKLLKGRKARIFYTMDAPAWYDWWMYNQAGIAAMKKATLQFCGIGPVAVSKFDRVRYRKPAEIARWLDRAATLGAKGL